MPLGDLNYLLEVDVKLICDQPRRLAYIRFKATK